MGLLFDPRWKLAAEAELTNNFMEMRCYSLYLHLGA